MRIAFRVDIGNEIGTGHYSRMTALADAFTELNHQCMFYKGEDEPVDYSSYDIVILDTYIVSDEYIAAFNAPDRLTVCYDDNALYTYSCDILLNANLHAHELEFRFGPKTPHLLLGGRYALLRSEFRDSPAVTIRDHASHVFVCFGGSDARNMTPKVIHTLKEIDGIHMSVVLGAYTKNDDEVLALSDKHVTVYKKPKSISEIMRKCDIAVTAAGSMVYESAAIGIPSILIVQADNQHRIAEYLARKEIMACAGSWDNIDFSKLRNEVAALLKNRTRRHEISKALIGLVDKNGAHNAANAILSRLCIPLEKS